MQNNITVITGKRGVGKTTSLHSIMEKLSKSGIATKGFITHFVENRRLVLDWIGIASQSIELAKKMERFSILPDLCSLNKVGRILKQESYVGDIFVVDEIGFLESLSKDMQEGILYALISSKNAVITLRKDRYPFLKKIKELQNVNIYDLDDYTYEERKKIEKMIFENLRG